MATLVLVEHAQSEMKESTLHAVTAALQFKEPVDCLVAGLNVADVAKKAANISGIRKVLHVESDALQHPLAESMAEVIREFANDYQHIVAPATTFGKNCLPRAAALLDVAQISDVIEIVDANTFVRPIYAGNALETVQSLDQKQLLTVRTTAFAAASLQDQTVSIETKSINLTSKTKWICEELTVLDRPELTVARRVVAGGRALQSAENFKLIEQLADTLNAAVGASRAAVDAGYVPNDYQVGQTGKVVAPDLYIAIGISGAIQHLAGGCRF